MPIVETLEKPVANVLIVEDQAKLRNNLQELLESCGHATVGAGCVTEACQALESTAFDLIILDLGLPGGDGLELLRTIRTGKSSTQVMILTARDTIEDRVTGLDAGADDYLIKPFAHAEFLARTRALLRRPTGKQESLIRFAGLELDFIARTVLRADSLIELSQKEFELLEYLLRHKDQDVSREMLARDVWKEPAGILTNAIDVCVNSLRRKIELPGLPKIISTVRGVGYTIRDDVP
jgi:two-component system OmpR family response regulator